MSPNSVGRSWITKPKWQILIGVFIGLCIFAAGFIPSLALQAERDQRQQDTNQEGIQRDKEIKHESIRITCGIVLAFERLTPQIQVTGNEDAATRGRIEKSNADRLAARAILRQSLPQDIVVHCPSSG